MVDLNFYGTPEDNPLLAAIDEGCKTGSVAIIGLIPVVGGLAAALLKHVFDGQENAKKENALLAMQTRMMLYSRTLVAQSEMERIRRAVEGKYAVLHSYANTKPNEQGRKLGDILNDMMTSMPDIAGIDSQIPTKEMLGNPEGHYVYFMTFATMHLSALRDQAYHFTYLNTDSTGRSTIDDNNRDLHMQELWKYYNIYIDHLRTVRDRLLTWRVNNISSDVERTVNRGVMGPDSTDSAVDFQWHDTILQLSYSISSWRSLYGDDDETSKQAQAATALANHRKMIVDMTTPSFKSYDGTLIQSYGHYLTLEMKPATRWRFLCYPEGGNPTPAILWEIVGIQDAGPPYGTATLMWKLKSAANVKANIREFPIGKYLHITNKFVPEWAVLNENTAAPEFPSPGMQVLLFPLDCGHGTTVLKSVGWSVDLAERLVLVETGLPEEQRVLQFLPTSLRDLKTWD